MSARDLVVTNGWLTANRLGKIRNRELVVRAEPDCGIDPRGLWWPKTRSRAKRGHNIAEDDGGPVVMLNLLR